VRLIFRRGQASQPDRLYRLNQAQYGALAVAAMLRYAREDDAEMLLDEVSRIATETDEGWWHAELQRLRGEVRFAMRGRNRRNGKRWNEATDDAERYFRRALEIADGQGARWWELRAAVSLARLLEDRGRVAEARETLAPVYARFSEGRELPDLRAAGQLLDSLQRP
jgi:hypothetical protein